METSLCHNGPSYVSSLGYRMLMLAAVCGGVDRISVGGCIRESESRCEGAHRTNWLSSSDRPGRESWYLRFLSEPETFNTCAPRIANTDESPHSAETGDDEPADIDSDEGFDPYTGGAESPYEGDAGDWYGED